MQLWICALALLPVALALSGSAGEYHDILGEGKAEWRLAFRGTAHIKESVYDAYLKKYDTKVDDACKGVNWAAACTTHYRNDDALDNWWAVKEVLFGVIKDGAMVKTIRFNGTGTDYANWFDNERYLDSCYQNFETEPKNYFSLRGQGGNRRRFFINRNYDGCSNNAGWFVAIDSETRTCNWERNTGSFPIFMYAGGPTYSNWNTNTASLADAFVVFVKYYPRPGQASEYFDVLGSGNKEWRLAFRATANVGVPVFKAYMDGTGIPADVAPACKSNDWSAACKSHYRNNDALKNYKWTEIEEVLFGVVDDGAIVKTIRFNARGTNFYSWFAQSRVIDACWNDFKLGKNIFSIRGHNDSRHGRTFYINNRYGGCGNDLGWVVSVDNAPVAPCPWEKSNSVPRLMYSAGPLKSNMLSKGMHDADAFVVFIKYKSM